MLSAYRVILSMIGILILAFTLGYAATWTVSAGDADTGDSNSEGLECSYLPSRYSIRSEYRDDLVMSVISTEDGPTGIDGGLISLLSSYRTCSR